MNSERLLHELTDISELYIAEAAPQNGAVGRKMPFRRIIAAAACFCLLLIGGIGGSLGANAYAQEVSYISLDVNPSLELCLNRWDRVVHVNTYNAEAESICGRLDLEHRHYTDAVEALLCDEEFLSYCAKDQADLTITIVSEDRDALQKGIEDCHGYTESGARICHADADTLQAAHESGCSVGRYEVHGAHDAEHEAQNITQHDDQHEAQHNSGGDHKTDSHHGREEHHS